MASSNLSSFRALVSCAPSKLSSPSAILVTMNGVRARVGAVRDDKVGTNAAANPLLATLRAATTAKIDDLNTVMALSL